MIYAKINLSHRCANICLLLRQGTSLWHLLRQEVTKSLELVLGPTAACAGLDGRGRGRHLPCTDDFWVSCI